MHAARRQSQDNIARGDVAARQQRVALGRADRETRQVEIAAGIHAGHLGGLAADQRATGAAAALGDAGDDAPSDLDLEAAGGVIIQEEQRLGALDHDVVDAHRHQVDAHRVVQAGLDGDLELGAHAIGAGHQDGIAKARGLEVEQAAEAAQAADYAAPVGAAGKRFDVARSAASRRHRYRRQRPCTVSGG